MVYFSEKKKDILICQNADIIYMKISTTVLKPNHYFNVHKRR
jgi:hypothetical protein